MKKILLATTILAASAGFASAEVALSGSAYMGLMNDFGAGDDTIFLAARSPADAAHAAERLLAPLGPRSTAARRQPVR